MEVLCAQGRTTSCKLKLAVDMARTVENAKQAQQVGPFLFLLVQRGNHRSIVECCHTLNTRCPTPMDLPNALLVRSSAATPNQLAHEPHTSYKLGSTPLSSTSSKRRIGSPGECLSRHGKCLHRGDKDGDADVRGTAVS